jgi:hypothetical protein
MLGTICLEEIESVEIPGLLRGESPSVWIDDRLSPRNILFPDRYDTRV